MDIKEEKRIDAIKPKPSFIPALQVATTKEGSVVVLLKDPLMILPFVILVIGAMNAYRSLQQVHQCQYSKSEYINQWICPEQDAIDPLD